VNQALYYLLHLLHRIDLAFVGSEWSQTYPRFRWVMSILALKIYHMKEQVERPEASEEHKAKCQAKLNVLLEQQVDLSTAIDQLLEDIEAGRKYMKVYRQMKMYNDPSTNPVLYKK
jgi:hypothetical protein